MSGKFIVVEGLEGAGKSTAIQLVTDVLARHGITHVELSREPGGTPLAEKLRQLVKSESTHEVITPEAELLMIYAARVQLVKNRIQPALAAGKWVVGDRHDLSTQAYQGGGRQLDAQLMLTLKRLVLGDFEPDLTLYLDIDPEQGLKRAMKRGELDRFEKEDLAFFERIRSRYLSFAEQNPNIITIDASRDLDQVSQSIETALTHWLTAIGK